MSMYAWPGFSWLDGQNKPGPSERDLQELEDTALEGKKHLGLKPSEAAKLAIDEVEKFRRDDLWISTQPCAHQPHVKQLLPRRVFHQLDKELFRGVLKGHVLLINREMQTRPWLPFVHSTTSKAGGQYPRISIGLSPIIYNLDILTILACLIHQMTHAYFLVCCGFGNDEGHNLQHGLAYSALLYTIQHRFLPERSHYTFPNLFQCCVNPRRFPAALPRPPRNGDGQSLCFWHFVQECDWGECRRYRDTLKELKLAKPEEEKKKTDDDEEPKSFPIEDRYPRSEWVHLINFVPAVFYTPRRRIEIFGRCPTYVNSFLELHHQGKAAPVPLTYLRKFPRLHASITQSVNHVITIPQNVDEKTFLSLYKFLCLGSYDPPPPPQASTSAGPPRIDTGSGNVHVTGDTVPIEDFRVYAVAQKICFDELKQYALSRLYSQTMLKGNPTEFLEEIYNGKKPEKDAPCATGKDWTPDDGLRTFVQAFLTAGHPDAVLSLREQPAGLWLGAGGRQLGFERQSNLSILKDKGEWKERLMKLRAGGGAFLEDLDKVEAKLKDGKPSAIIGGMPQGWRDDSSTDDISTAARGIYPAPSAAAGLGVDPSVAGALGGALGLGFNLGVGGMNVLLEENAMAGTTGTLPLRLLPPRAAVPAIGVADAPGGGRLGRVRVLVDGDGRPILGGAYRRAMSWEVGGFQ